MTAPLRVLFVTPSLSPLRGGPSIMVKEMARVLVGRGCIVEVVTTDDNDTARRDPREEADVTFRVEVFPRLTHFYTIAPQLGRWVSRHCDDYDLVHLFALFSYPVRPVVVAARAAQVPLVISPLGSLNEWGLTRNHPLMKRVSLALVERKALRQAAAVHFNSEDEARQAHRVAAFRRSEVIPPPVGAFFPPTDHELDRFFDLFPVLKDRRIILFMGRFDPTKGLELLIPAFAAVRKRAEDVVLVLAGDGPDHVTSEVKRLVHAHGVEAQVLRVGFLDAQTKRAALAAATLLVQPSHTENFGISAAEGLSAGLPVVVTETSGISALVRESGAGFVVSPTTEQITEALLKLLTDDRAMKACADRAAVAVGHFAPERVAAQFHNLYLDLV